MNAPDFSKRALIGDGVELTKQETRVTESTRGLWCSRRGPTVWVGVGPKVDASVSLGFFGPSFIEITPAEARHIAAALNRLADEAAA